MLVLTRKQGERIRIGSEIEIVVLRACAGQVRLGIEAPRRIQVVRDELGKPKKKGTRHEHHT